MTVLASMLERSVFSVGETEYRWEDVVLVADVTGAWAGLERQTVEGAACVRRADAEGDRAGAADVDSAARQFRYQRNLLAGQEMRAWLDRWGLSVWAWLAFVRRTVLRRRWSAQLGETLDRYPVSKDALAEEILIDAICSGALSAMARRLAASAAVYAALRPDGADESPAARLAADAHPGLEHLGIAPERAGERLASLGQLRSAVAEFREQVVTARALRERVNARQLDWVRVKYRSLGLPDGATAREAVLCVRDDGQELEVIAAQAGTRVTGTELYLEDAQPALRERLLSGDQGELLGPVSGPDGDEFLVVMIDEKSAPSLEDPEIRRRAEKEILGRALEQAINDRVRWHEHP